MPLLQTGDVDPVMVRRAGAGASVLVICDHAGRATPRVLGGMGVAAADWERHIAWDIGAAALAIRLGEAFGATVLLQAYSRLVIDANRDPSRADAVPAVSDGTPVPANLDLSPQARSERAAEIHAPYHAAIARELDARAARREATRLLFVHSFTPRMNGGDRPWRFGVLHMGDSAFSTAMIAALRGAGEDPVGDNEPYAMDQTDYSAPTHAIARGLDYLELEVRQDLIADEDGVARVAGFLAPLIVAAAGGALSG